MEDVANEPTALPMLLAEKLLGMSPKHQNHPRGGWGILGYMYHSSVYKLKRNMTPFLLIAQNKHRQAPVKCRWWILTNEFGSVKWSTITMKFCVGHVGMFVVIPPLNLIHDSGMMDSGQS